MKNKIVLVFLLISVMLLIGTFSYSQAMSDDAITVFQEYDKRIDLIKTNLDYVWIIISAMLVFFMQAGFMSLESGMARSKNSINVAIKNLTDFVLGFIGFWVIGFGIMFGKSWNGLLGVSDFLVSIENPWTAAFFMFQAVFVGTAATIDSGAICGRAKLKQYILLSLILSVFIYPVFGHWAWGSFLHGSDPITGGAGWLEAIGFKDFAGSSVVHSLGGWVALAGVIIVGPRIGRFQIDKKTGKKGKANKIHPGDMRFVFFGTFILFFGWFGFNCGSTLSATSDIAPIALNTTISACFGCLASSVLSWILHPEKKIEGEMIANGVLAGLVGITAGCAFVSAESAAIIGLVSGIIVYAGTAFLEKVLKVDDVVGAIPVHAFCGAWGTIAVGIFILPQFLGDLTHFEQFKVQLIGVGVCFAWAFGTGLLFYFLVDKFLGGIRVSEEEEIMGLNIAEHGAKSSIIELANTMNTLTESGDFSGDAEVHVELGTEIGDLASLFNRMIDRVKAALIESRNQRAIAENMLKESEAQKQKVLEAQFELNRQREEAAALRAEFISETHGKVSSVTNRIDGVRDLMVQTSSVTREMTDSFGNLEETLQVMLDSLGGIYSQLGQLKTITKTTSDTTKKSRTYVEDLRAVTSEIAGLVGLINEIAEKTHLLSINSGIEAARAGDTGKGFVIISKEIRDLSQKTSKTAGNIGTKLIDVDERVSNVTEALTTILGIFDEINNLNSHIISVVEENRSISDSIQLKSSNAIHAAESVAADVLNVVDEASQLSTIGNQVVTELKGIK